MQNVTVYRTGDLYALEPATDEARPVVIALPLGIRLGSSASGELRVYRKGHPYGMKLDTALSLGLVFLMEPRRPEAEG